MRKHSLSGKSFTKLLGFRSDFSACLLWVAVIALFAGCAILFRGLGFLRQPSA